MAAAKKPKCSAGSKVSASTANLMRPARRMAGSPRASAGPRAPASSTASLPAWRRKAPKGQRAAGRARQGGTERQKVQGWRRWGS
eukprot:6125678-Alexandrium_andersonii.AAC.1